MQRRTFLLKTAGTGVVSGSALASAPVLAQTNPKIHWRLTSAFVPALPSFNSSLRDVFSAQVAQATNGNFTIRVYPGGELVPGYAVLDAVSNRTVECGNTASYYHYGANPAFCFDATVPFGLNARQMRAWMFQGDGLKLMRELFATRNIINFPMGNTGAQMGGWYRKEVNTLDDLKGLKMRTAGFAGEVLSRMGVIPQQIPAGDIYPALEKGTLDAVEFSSPLDDEKLGFQKVARYYYYPGWWEGCAQISLYVNDSAFHELPKHYQSIIEQAASQAHVRMMAHYDAENSAALRRLIAGGAVLKVFSREIMDEAFRTSEMLYKEFCDKDPVFKKIHDSYMAFRDELVPWFRLNEGAYDNYLGIALAGRK